MELLKLLFIMMVLFGIIWGIFEKNRTIWKTITDKLNSFQDWKIRLSLFIFVVLSEGWMVFLRKLPIAADEVYSMSGASFFAGYNWSSYMHLKKFYNFGYTMLLTPIYKLFSDPITIYRAMLFCNVIIHAITVVIAYHVLSSKFKCPKSLSIGIAFVSTCNAIILFFKGFIYNEMPLALVVWMILWLLLELTETTGKRRIVLSTLLGGLAAYGYIIHSRCIIIYGALVVLVFFYLLVYRKWLIQPISFAFAFTVCFSLEKILLDYVQRNLYLKGSDIVMGNSVEHVMTGTWRYKSLTTLEGIWDIILRFFSHAGALTIETGGLLTIVTVAVIYYFVKNWGNYRKGKENKLLFIIMIFSSIALWSMVAAIALTGASNGKIRFIAYTRYFMPFIGPFIMLGLIILKNYSKFKYKWMVLWSGVLTAIVGGVYVFFAYPILNGTTMREITSYYFFMAFARYSSQVKFSKNVFAIALFLLVVYTLIMLMLYRKKQLFSLCVIAMIFSTALLWRVEKTQNEPSSSRRYMMSNSTYELLKNEESLNEKDLYCSGSGLYKKAVLVSSYDQEDIIYAFDKIQNNKDAVLLSNRVKDLEKYNATYIYQLDKNEWVGFWDDALTDDFEKKYTPYSVQ
ncbi:MAG: hypothetical protein IJD40_07010 [Lachnospiraceae bacterium]|nr:hypothetical protein [Lachnospiraceae bacterium]